MKPLTFDDYCSIYTDRASESEHERYIGIVNKIIKQLPFENASELSHEELSERLNVSDLIKCGHNVVMASPAMSLAIFSFQSKKDPNMVELLNFEDFFMSNLKIPKDASTKLSGILAYIECYYNLPIKVEVLNKMKSDFTQYFTLEQSVKSLKTKINMKDSIYHDGIHQTLLAQKPNNKV